MTTQHDPDTALKDAFIAAGDHATLEPSSDDVERVWRAVSGELTLDERHQLVDRTASEPGLAHAWRVAHELRQAQQQHAITAVAPRTNRWWPAALMGIAATLVLAAGAGIFYVDRAPADTFRDSGRVTIESLVNTDVALPRDAFVLKWKPGPQGSRYLVRVTTEDLQVLTTASDLTTSELTVPSSALAPVAAGGRVLWQVVMSAPGGETVSSPTFVARVQ